MAEETVTYRHRLTILHRQEYNSWTNMRSRCLNPKTPNYDRYGGRGITVCQRWAHFEFFFADMGSRPTPEHSLERKNNEGNYEPGNVVWATRVEQMNNTRQCQYYLFFGERMTITQAARKYGMSRDTLNGRLTISKLSPDIAVTAPPQRTGRPPKKK